MRFRKRKKILPGVYLNFSKSGISTTVGAKGASVSLGSRGTFLNTSIPGTGIYDRRKIGKSKVRTTGNATFKSKNTAAILALFFGSVGIHRFYLGQNGYGFLYLIFCWTLIPLVIAVLDAMIFLVMSSDHFNRKFNVTYIK